MYKITTTKKSELYDEKYASRVSKLVAAGFERENDQAVYQDTMEHLEESPIVLEARTNTGDIQAIAMARRCLWR